MRDKKRKAKSTTKVAATIRIDNADLVRRMVSVCTEMKKHPGYAKYQAMSSTPKIAISVLLEWVEEKESELGIES